MFSARIAVVNCFSCQRCLSGAPPLPHQRGLGLHAKPSARIAQVAEKQTSKIVITRRQESVPATSIMGIFCLDVQPRQTITINATGGNDTAAVEDIARLLVHGFGEPHCPDFTQFVERLGSKGEKAPEALNPLFVLTEFAAEISRNPVCIRGKYSDPGEDA
jgi:phosphocarrier protein HPr